MRPAAPLVALDVSLSWLRASDTAAWAAARDQARRTGGDSLLLVGEAPRMGAAPELPADTATDLIAAAARAQLAGRPLHLYTDGVFPGDSSELHSRLPSGSQLFVHPVERQPDLGIVALEVPPSARAGDTLRVRVLLAAGERVPAAAVLRTRVDGNVVASAPLPGFAPWQRRTEEIAFRVPPGDARAQLEIVLDAPGDGEPRNDTASRVLRRGERMNAVAVSTAPDVDFRELVRVLRGALSLPTAARFRIAPDRWIDESGRPVPQSQVRLEFAGAQVAVIHGDTALFGPPRAVARGALVLIPPPADDTEWYLSAALPSPLAAGLATMEFDTLPPVAADAATAGIPLLEARGPGQRRQHVGALEDSVRRVLIVPVRGTGRWALRGGAAADAFATLWGNVFAAAAERAGAEFVAPEPVVPASEFHPLAPVLTTGRVGDAAAGLHRAGLRTARWPYALLVILLCAEWLLRRRSGLR